MDAIQVPMPAVCGPEKAPCSPDWLPRPVDGWPDRCSPTTEHVAGADDAQPAQQQQQHRQHHELVRRSRAAVCSRGLHAAYRRYRTRVVGWVKGVSRGASAPVLIASRRAASRSCRRTRRSRQAAPSRWRAGPAAVPRHGVIARPRGAHCWTVSPVGAHRTGRYKVSRSGRAPARVRRACASHLGPSSIPPLNFRHVCAARRRGGPERRAAPRWNRGKRYQVLRAAGALAVCTSCQLCHSQGPLGRQLGQDEPGKSCE
jgi:hypothetical protein